MPRDSNVYLEDILEAARKIRAYTKGLSYETFRENSMAVDAVIRNLEVIGEAAKQPPRFRSSAGAGGPMEKNRRASRHPHPRLLRNRLRDHLGCGH